MSLLDFTKSRIDVLLTFHIDPCVSFLFWRAKCVVKTLGDLMQPMQFEYLKNISIYNFFNLEIIVS